MYRSILPIALAACFGTAAAQVYQSTDEQGDPVYSDMPTPGSEAIEVSEPNVGDAVEVPPPPPPPQPVERPEIVPDREPSDVDGELIEVERKDNNGNDHNRPRPRRDQDGHGRGR